MSKVYNKATHNSSNATLKILPQVAGPQRTMRYAINIPLMTIDCEQLQNITSIDEGDNKSCVEESFYTRF